jgi:hypothetical protein
MPGKPRLIRDLDFQCRESHAHNLGRYYKLSFRARQRFLSQLKADVQNFTKATEFGLSCVTQADLKALRFSMHLEIY